MNRSTCTTIATLILLCASAASWSKGAINRIVIDPMDAGTPIVITDPEVLERFAIWTGPGVVGWTTADTPDPGEPGFLIDWATGPASDLPKDLKHYKVTLYVDDREAPRNTYEVLYSTNRSARAGYIYLPGPNDDIGLSNTSLIYRGVEGNWFRASQAWEATVKPLLASASNE